MWQDTKIIIFKIFYVCRLLVKMLAIVFAHLDICICSPVPSAHIDIRHLKKERSDKQSLKGGPNGGEL